VSTPPSSIRLLATPWGLEHVEKGKSLFVVIDVLRACTTIAYALGAGAHRIIPMETVEDATRLASTLDREATLLCGERDSKRIEGFDLGNSPREYTAAVVDSKTLVLSTTNGARAMAALSGAKACIAASLVTLAACTRRIVDASSVTIVCAGSGSYFSREDFLCAGMLVERVLAQARHEIHLDDGTRTALELSRTHGSDPLAFLRGTDHGRTLLELGFEGDLELASEVDRFDFVPVLRDGRLAAEPDPAEMPPR
jgi:2-phosphosulfolactate phosphatase